MNPSALPRHLTHGTPLRVSPSFLSFLSATIIQIMRWYSVTSGRALPYAYLSVGEAREDYRRRVREGKPRVRITEWMGDPGDPEASRVLRVIEEAPTRPVCRRGVSA